MALYVLRWLPLLLGFKQMSAVPIDVSREETPQIVGKYRLGKVLGAGDFDCRIRLCTHVSTGLQYAIKIYDKNVLREYQWMWDQIRDAIQVMRTLPKHEFIVEMV